MEISPKPKCPKKVYRWFILYYTITDYFYIAPDYKTNKVLKPGWHAIRQYNEDHPLRKRQWKALRKKREQILKNQEVDWEALEKIRITI